MTSNSVQAGIRIPGSPRYVPNAAAGISPLPSRRCPSGGRHWLGWFGSFVDCFSDVLRSFCSLPPCSVLKYSMLCLGSESCLPFSGGFGASFQTGFGSSSGKRLSGRGEAMRVSPKRSEGATQVPLCPKRECRGIIGLLRDLPRVVEP